MNASTSLALVLALATTAGCVSLRPVAPGTLPELGRNEGILVVHVRTALPIGKLVLSRATAGRDLGKGEHLLFFALAAGSYRWTEILIPVGEREARFVMARDDVWKLRVDAGRINYAGLLIFGGRTHQTGVELSARHLNRSAYSLGRLRAVFPELLGRYPLVYAGAARDDFLEHYSRRFLTREDSAATEAPR